MIMNEQSFKLPKLFYIGTSQTTEVKCAENWKIIDSFMHYIPVLVSFLPILVYLVKNESRLFMFNKENNYDKTLPKFLQRN